MHIDDSNAIAPLAAGQRMTVQDIPRGIRCMIAATAMFAISSACAKLQVATYPIGEIMFARSASSLLFCMFFVLPTTGIAVFSTRMPMAHLARGLSQSISQTFTVLALATMPFAGVTAIGFTAPLFAALISIVVLRASCLKKESKGIPESA